jgi:hypothetical protein
VSAITRKKLISKDVKSTPQEKESSYLLTVLLLLLVLPLLIVFPEVIFPLPPVMFLDTPMLLELPILLPCASTCCIEPIASTDTARMEQMMAAYDASVCLLYIKYWILYSSKTKYGSQYRIMSSKR